jgi:hypothetical protein
MVSETNKELMDIVGRRDLEVTFVIQPGQSDELQSVILFSRVWEKVATDSIMRGSGSRQN